jgi:hypothetical protein
LPVAEGDTGPPGPIPNPVVKRVSADGYCGSNAVGDVAAAGSSRPDSLLLCPSNDRSVAALWPVTSVVTSDGCCGAVVVYG